MSDRKMIKWQAFDSVMNSKKIVNEISKNKENTLMPILSEEQLIEIERALIKALECNLKITINYFYNSKIFSTKDFIKQIDPIKKRIIFKTHHPLYFNQIISVTI